jgi:aspartyl-tRNA(Asn)/glutamyl-tRNA(Gln) amidotransferase subunit A
MGELADLTIKEAGAGLRKRSFSSRELTEAVLARLAATEDQLHAYVEVRAEAALAEADEADQEIADAENCGALHGIPIAVKDIIDVAGMVTRCGSRVRENAPLAIEDAKVVAFARDGGAVILGKTVTQEFAAGVVSAPARNPWDPTRIPGGSSGGTGAAVAAGSAMAGFGSDTGGSIRNPASVNGVVGLKPTFGTVLTHGVQPLAWSLDTVGPIAKTVEDAAHFLDIIRGDDPLGHGLFPLGQPLAASLIGQRIRGLRVGVSRPYFFDRLTPGVEHATEAAIEVLRKQGAKIIEAPWADAAAARAASFVINRVETVAVHEKGLREDPDLYAPELRLRLEANLLYPAIGYVQAQQARTAVQASMAALFNDNQLDVLIAPTCPGAAVPADDLYVVYPDGERESVNLAYTRLTMPFNATGQPVISVPCGFDDGHLPVGMQIVGRPYDEATICMVGHAFEQAAGWQHRQPPIVKQLQA